MTLDHLPLDADPADIAPADALRRWLDAQPGWRRHAACAGTDPSVFFPVRGESTADALHVCGRCPVLTDCREWAIADASLDYGVLGGMTARARKAARRARRNRPSAR
ncbi:MAG: WhiB family transcriptional regulator [Acidimicrobiia bacterium]|nr:WhiB family transcriptional regulator [Acidimicrobiia bacterium]